MSCIFDSQVSRRERGLGVAIFVQVDLYNDRKVVVCMMINNLMDVSCRVSAAGMHLRSPGAGLAGRTDT